MGAPDPAFSGRVPPSCSPIYRLRNLSPPPAAQVPLLLKSTVRPPRCRTHSALNPEPVRISGEDSVFRRRFLPDSRRRSTPASGVLPLFPPGAKAPPGQLLHLQLSANPALAGRLPAQALRPDALIPAASSWGCVNVTRKWQYIFS